MFDFSSFFGGSSSSNSSFMGSINFSDYRMIKSGSYGKLMKAYYSDSKTSASSTSKTSSTKKSSKSVLDQILEKKHVANAKDTSGLTQMKSKVDSLKTAAEAFDGSDVFAKEDGAYDTDKIYKAVNDFANKYNSTLDQAGKTVSKEISSQIGYMKDMTNTMSKELEKIGITIGADGKLTVNEDKLKSASVDDVKALFSGSYSYAADIADKAGAIGSTALRDSSIYSSSGTWSSSSSSDFNSMA